MSNTYRKRSVQILAMQWTGENTKEVVEFTGAHNHTPTGNSLIFSNNDMSHTMKKGDYVKKEGASIVVMDKYVFESLYEKEVE